MTVETGTAESYLDLYTRLRSFLLSLRQPQNISFTGSGPGGFSEAPDASRSAEVETWTLTVIDATTSGSEVWSVEGSVTGATSDATTGQAYDNGSISFTIGGDGYAVDDVFTLDVEVSWEQKEYVSRRNVDTISFTGSGPGTFATAPDGKAGALLETWTLTVIDASTSGSEVWSVEGSVTGVTADATTGQVYDNGSITFTIDGTGYAVDDQFTFDVVAPWGDTSIDATDQMILMGRGVTGNENLYIGLRAYADTGNDIFNWEMMGYVGYVSGNNFEDHPNPTRFLYMSLWNDKIPYWFVANANRVIVVTKVSTTYHAIYLGRFLPYATPNQYPLPLLVAGTSTNKGNRFSTERGDHRCFWTPGQGAAQFIWPDNKWYNLENYENNGGGESSIGQNRVYPDLLENWRSINVDGSVTLVPYFFVAKNPDGAVVGEFEGVAKVNGYGLSSEDIVTADGTDWLVVQNIMRTRVQDFAAIRLE